MNDVVLYHKKSNELLIAHKVNEMVEIGPGDFYRAEATFKLEHPKMYPGTYIQIINETLPKESSFVVIGEL